METNDRGINGIIIAGLSLLLAVTIVSLGASIMETIQEEQNDQTSGSGIETFNIPVSSTKSLVQSNIVSGSETLIFCESP